MTSDRALAAALWCARQQGGAVPREAADAIADAAAAYAVQREMVDLTGMTRAGWKVGATSRAAQELLGVDGGQDLVAAVGLGPGRQVAAEAERELAFDAGVLARVHGHGGRAVEALGREHGRRRRAVDAVMPAIEVVSCRFEGGFAGLGGLRLIADLVANRGWVRGGAETDWHERDLKAHPVTLARNGDVVAEGVGANALGDPLAVLEWTANQLSSLGDGIRAGEVVSTGTCTGVTFVEPGDVMVADFADLGPVEVRFDAAG